jgi:hypothetical protein
VTWGNVISLIAIANTLYVLIFALMLMAIYTLTMRAMAKTARRSSDAWHRIRLRGR